MNLISAVVTLLLVMDPLGNVPLFITALRTVKHDRRMFVVIREQFIALFIMVVFLFAGRGLLQVLNVTPDALNVAGGLILLLIAVRMIFPTEDKNLNEPVLVEPLIVPLAVPYTAGPSLLATEILFVSREPNRLGFWLLALGIAWLISAAILTSAGWLQKFLGERAMTAIERLMGMILVIVSTQMMLSGIHDFFLA